MFGDRPDEKDQGTATEWDRGTGGGDTTLEEKWTCGGVIQFEYYVHEEDKDELKMKVKAESSAGF